MSKPQLMIPVASVEQAIFLVRGQKMMLDRDWAAFYGVDTKASKRAVRRNMERFPADFMFELTSEEANAIERSRCQSGTLKRGQNPKYLPYVFSQEGVAMLASVLRSPQAARVNVAIMRAFVRLRETLALHKELAHKLTDLERKIGTHDESIRTLFEAIRQLMRPPDPPRREIGFHMKEKGVLYRIGRTPRVRES